MPNNQKPTPVIAYICDGYDKCALEPGCYMRKEPVSKSDWVCHHTTNTEHAANGPCDNPDNYPERFVLVNGEKLDYYEKLPGEEL